MNLPERNYETLDAIAVIYSMTIVAGIIVGLFAVKVDPAVAPIISSLGTALLAMPGMYAAFRWGNSVGAKQSNDAMAQMAGAGPPPPSTPMSEEPFVEEMRP